MTFTFQSRSANTPAFAMTPEGYHSAYYNIFISPYGEWTYACPLVGQWLVDCLFDSAGVSVGVVHANIRLVRVRIVIIVGR